MLIHLPQKLLGVVLLEAAKHRMHISNAIQDAIRNDVTIRAFVFQPHIFDQPIVALGQASLALAAIRRRHFAISLYNLAALQKVSGQWWCIRERLQGCIHIASVRYILQTHQAARITIIGRFIITIVVCTAVVRFIIVHGASRCGRRCRPFIREYFLRISAHIVIAVVVDDATIFGDGANAEKHFHFAHVTPYSLRRLIHVNAMAGILLEMDGTVILEILRAADVKAVLVQANP